MLDRRTLDSFNAWREWAMGRSRHEGPCSSWGHRVRGWGRSFALTVAAVLSLVSLHGNAREADPAIVVNGSSALMGVASCGGSTCHGRQTPTGAVVRQDEVRIWQDASSVTGMHAHAFRVLEEPRSQAIAAKLGIGPATSATECLGCHSTPAARYSAGFHKDEGVTCEACHGAAERWLASHTAVAGTHVDNVRHGLIPLDRPRARAENCLDCHYGGGGNQFVTHRIMAAGHPRISYELELFTALQQHHNVDADYRQRKETPSGIKVWAVGQAIALERQLTLFASARGQNGAFPEFYFYDCRSCHRAISDQPDWRPQRTVNPLRPVAVGTPVFNDENLIMLAAAAQVAAPDLADRFATDARAFHAAIGQGRDPAKAAAAKLRATATALAARFESATFGRAETFAMMRAVLTGPATRTYTDYQGSAQSVMAADTLLASLERDKQVPAGARAAIKPDLDRAYAAVRDPQRFQSADVAASLARVADAVARYQ